MKNRKLKILATTGIRSEYDILYPVICELRDRGHDVKLIISGAHLSDWHGTSLDTIQKDGFEILGFPCNQFGAQEPGTNEEIQFFCTEKYEVGFPIFDKIEVNGDNASPIYEFLKKDHPGESGSENIEWNFTKFLIGKNGKIVKRFGPKSEPSEIKSDIERLINE